MPVWVLAGGPPQAFVADFQNLWGGVLAFGIGATLFATAFWMSATAAGKPPPSA